MSDPSKSLASSTLASASSLMALQLLSRLFTFAFNQALLRLASPKVFGTAAIQFELLLNTVLFLSRDGVRNALIRNWPRKESNSDTKQMQEDSEQQQHRKTIENIAYIPLMIGLPLAALVAFVYVRYLTGEEAGSQPHFVLAVSLYALAAVVELVSEPMHNKAMGELRTIVRVRAEGLGITAKTLVTFLVLVYDARRSGNAEGRLALLAFAFGQLAYSGAVLATYAADTGYVTLSPSRSGNQTFDPATLELSMTMTSQSLVKYFLTECDKLILSMLSPLQDQGGYALAVNYGSLVARIVFQPIEESSRVYFSKLLVLTTADSSEKSKPIKSPAPASLQQAADVIISIVQTQLSLSLILVVFGTIYAPLGLQILLPPRFMATSAPSVLAVWIWYIPVLAVNGELEAFLSSVATSADLNRQSRWMTVFSVVFVGATLFFYSLGLGDTSLVYANIINSTTRIIYCSLFITSYFSRHGARNKLEWKKTLPPSPLVLFCAFSAAALGTKRDVLDVGKFASLRDRGTLVPMLAHIGVGGTLAVVSLGIWWYTTGKRAILPRRKQS